MSSREGLQDQPGKETVPDRDGSGGGMQAGMSLRPLLESLEGEEFIVTVLFGEGGRGMQDAHELKRVAIRLVPEPPLCSDQPVRCPEDVVRVLGRELQDYDREVACCRTAN